MAKATTAMSCIVAFTMYALIGFTASPAFADSKNAQKAEREAQLKEYLLGGDIWNVPADNL